MNPPNLKSMHSYVLKCAWVAFSSSARHNVVAQNFSLKTRLEVLLKFYMKIINGGTDPGGLLSNGKYPS